MIEVQEISNRCECGQRYSLFVYEDGHVERNMPIHCQACHRGTYEHVIMLCDDCYHVADLRGIGHALRMQLDGEDDGEPVVKG